MIIREPVVAGQFYPANPDQCRAEVLQYLSEGSADHTTDSRLLGGIVPHAGWVFSGAVAARVFNALAASGTPDVIVLVGSVHRIRGREAALFGAGRWETPLGPLEVDSRLAERILGHTNLIVDDPYAHEQEHSIEVQMPFVKHLFPEAKVVPIMVPQVPTAYEVGEAIGRTLTAYKYNALIVGTTDLTHYGPRYGFIPHGSMRAKEVVSEAIEHKNACGGGATAATVAAVAALGATKGMLLEHTTSTEVAGGRMPDDQADSVGYAAIVFE